MILNSYTGPPLENTLSAHACDMLGLLMLSEGGEILGEELTLCTVVRLVGVTLLLVLLQPGQRVGVKVTDITFMTEGWWFLLP